MCCATSRQTPAAGSCHGLDPWRMTLAASHHSHNDPRIPPACPVEVHVASCFSGQRETPQDKPVASSVRVQPSPLATNMSAPPDKPVVSNYGPPPHFTMPLPSLIVTI